MKPETFWIHVDDFEDCWTWTGYRNGDGYGVARWGGRNRKAHRIAWTLVNGPIGAGLEVCHHCDNPPCVNPAHLFLATHRDNMRDAAAKGRVTAQAKPWALRRGDAHHMRTRPELVRRGEAHHAARLTRSDVDAIRATWDEGSTKQVDIARRYAVSKSTIYQIVKGATWK